MKPLTDQEFEQVLEESNVSPFEKMKLRIQYETLKQNGFKPVKVKPAKK